MTEPPDTPPAIEEPSLAPEVRSAWAAILRASKQPVIGTWVGRDLAEPGDDPVRRRALLVLVQHCPTPAVVPPLIGWVSDPAWGPPAQRLLATLLGTGEQSAESWRRWWAERSGSVAPDLGTGWLED